MQHKEGGVLYCLDVTKCMFSSGNTTVRQRMGQLDCAGETVVDLYAGIGYYTLPFLCKAGAPFVCTPGKPRPLLAGSCSCGVGLELTPVTLFALYAAVITELC